MHETKGAAENRMTKQASQPRTDRAKVLIVDDNKLYRAALSRNLTLHNCDVLEAHDMEDALERIELDSPEIVVTDLQMRRDTEGIELIKEVKRQYPLLPIIMISAVGTFEDGAQAQKYGASSVIAKSKIEEGIEQLYAAIDRAHEEYVRNVALQARLKEAAEIVDYRPEAEVKAIVDELVKLMGRADVPDTLRAEAYNLYVRANTERLRQESREAAQGAGLILTDEIIASVDRLLAEALPCYHELEDESKENLRFAEFLYREHSRHPQSLDFSRNIGFSYCFAVETVVKRQLHKRLQRFFSKPDTYALIEELLEGPQRNLSVHFRQHLLVVMRGRNWDVTPDNIRQTFLRLLEHQARYKPDGLKALGILIVAFAREYTIEGTRSKKKITISNPLLLKGLETEEEVLRFAELLVELQHYRNPYIHPEISELEKIPVIRKKAMECITIANQVH
jgi:CheY-like chemotaxis protein